MAVSISSYPHVHALTKKCVVAGKRPIRSTSPSVATLCSSQNLSARAVSGDIRAETDLRRRLCARPHRCCIQINSVQSLSSALNKEGPQEGILGDGFQETGFGTNVSGMEDRPLGTLYEVPMKRKRLSADCIRAILQPYITAPGQ
jgi:hypothetical protein